jgi:hypothetical protein
VKTDISFVHCGDSLKRTLAGEIQEVQSAIPAGRWCASFSFTGNYSVHNHQTAYNRAIPMPSASVENMAESLWHTPVSPSCRSTCQMFTEPVGHEHVIADAACNGQCELRRGVSKGAIVIAPARHELERPAARGPCARSSKPLATGCASSVTALVRPAEPGRLESVVGCAWRYTSCRYRPGLSEERQNAHLGRSQAARSRRQEVG